jgi:hypothetical protein
VWHRFLANRVPYAMELDRLLASLFTKLSTVVLRRLFVFGTRPTYSEARRNGSLRAWKGYAIAIFTVQAYSRPDSRPRAPNRTETRANLLLLRFEKPRQAERLSLDEANR